MCYGFPCGWWSDWAETCTKPLWEDCPEKQAQDMPPEEDDDLFPEEHVMAFLRGLLEEAMEKQPCD